MSDDPIYPTHTCFDDALEYMAMSIDTHGRKYAEALVLVHAVCQAVGHGHMFSHAWVEDADGTIWEGGILRGEKIYVGSTREETLTRFNVVRCTKYTIREAAAMNALHNNYGPWEPEYCELCLRPGDKRETFESRSA